MDPKIYPLKSVVDTFATIGLVSTLVRLANQHRAELDLVNDSNLDIYFGFGHAAILGSGKMLTPGGSYHMGPENLFHGAIYGIAVAGGNNLTISEGLV